MRIKLNLNIKPKKVLSIGLLVSFIMGSTFSFDVRASDEKVVYPLKEISKLDCRFDKFSSLSSSCIEDLPVLNTKDYNKYIKQDGGYNDYTRLYTVLWGSSYKYGWDVGNGGHQGVDIATAEGTPVYSIADGTVIVADNDPSWGNVISIQHTIRGKKVVSNYAHLSVIDVKKGDKVKSGEEIGEVGSTGNSTGNHLHFQIDLEYLFHPFYYSWETCPYGYYDITETGVCFEELAANTLDPLEFLEGEGAVLDEITIKNTTKNVTTKISTSSEVTGNLKNSGTSHQENTIDGFDMNIFYKTVHTEMGSTKDDVKAVQTIFSDLGYYDGKIDGIFANVESAIIEYQLDKTIIASTDDLGAGWFGPKTRAIVKTDYTKYLSSTENDEDSSKKIVSTGTEESSTGTSGTVDRVIEKIDRTDILSREEIEAREIDAFLKKNEVNFNIEGVGGNIKVGEDIKIEFTIDKIINNTKRKAYVGSFPGAITFELDESVVSVFPQKLTTISNGSRDIYLKGLNTGNTTLKIKLGETVIKTFELKIFEESASIYPKTATILAQRSIYLGESKTAIVVFKDDAKKNLINLPFKGTFILDTGDDAAVCIKRGSLSDIRRIYSSKCSDSDYVTNPEITYEDTVGGLLLYDYKVFSTSDSEIALLGKGSGNTYSTSALTVSLPKGLNKDYDYYDETLSMLEKGIVSGTKQGYFMEDNILTHKVAGEWIKNTLIQISEETNDENIKAQVSKKLVELQKDNMTANTSITRKDFLEKAYDYLVVNEKAYGISIEYQDLFDIDNAKANAIFDKNNTWKDKFGENYFQPTQKVTRGEGAYLLSQAFGKSQTLFLAMR